MEKMNGVGTTRSTKGGTNCYAVPTGLIATKDCFAVGTTRSTKGGTNCFAVHQERMKKTNDKDVAECEAEINRLNSLLEFVDKGIKIHESQLKNLSNEKEEIERKVQKLQKKADNLNKFGKTLNPLI